MKRHFALSIVAFRTRRSRPGVLGWEVDDVARKIFHRRSGRVAVCARAPDGTGLPRRRTVLGPRWERYGQRPYGALEKDEVYTLEIGCLVPGYGFVSQERTLSTADGCGSR